MKTKFNTDMINMISSLIGKVFINYECDLEEKWNRTYGYLRINTNDESIDISNEQDSVILFGEKEDVACFKCFISGENTLKESFDLIDEYEAKQISVGEVINSISIISEKVKITENNTTDEMEFDMAIIIKTDKHNYTISREEWFSELIYINVDKEFNDIYPIEKDKEDWSNDEDRKVEIERFIVELK